MDALAGDGDPQALAVIERSADALAGMVATVARELGLPRPAVCVSGGALRHLQQLQVAFSGALRHQAPGAQLVEPAGDACDGALALAAQAALRC